MTSEATIELIQAAIQRINLGRNSEAQISSDPQAPLFGNGSPLDSLGLVSLLIEIEEAFQDQGHEISLSDARAMSQANSPFRSISALVEYISTAASTKS